MELSPIKKASRKSVNPLNAMPQSHKIFLGKDVIEAEFAQFEWCSAILAVSTVDTLLFYEIEFTEADICPYPSRSKLVDELQIGEDFHCNLLSFSPKTDVTCITKSIRIACGDSTSRVFRYYPAIASRTYVEIDVHRSRVNDIAIEPICGNVIASVGDDLRCVITALPDAPNGQTTCQFWLESAGFKVEWHRSVEGKILVAEKKGIITVFDIVQERAERSFDCQSSPFMYINWCASDSTKIAGIAAKKWYFWDYNSSLHTDEGDMTYNPHRVKFSNVDKDLVVMRSLNGDELSIKIENLGCVDLPNLPVGNGLSFHANRNVVAICGLESVYVFRIIGGGIPDNSNSSSMQDDEDV